MKCKPKTEKQFTVNIIQNLSKIRNDNVLVIFDKKVNFYVKKVKKI